MIQVNKIYNEKRQFRANEKGVKSMDEVNEEIQNEKKEEEKNNVANLGVTLLFVVLAVVIGFAILLCMQ